MTASKFKLGDRVYCPWHGYGTITTIYDDGCLYPIEVTWDEMIRGEKFITTYTADGYSMAGAQDGVPYLTVLRVHQ
nr:MAG TPA: ATP-dependent DNA helicase [Caudoviricetes sp.]